MSQYIHFFIRNGEQFLPIGTYSRSTAIYQTFADYAPYGHISAIKSTTLDWVDKDIKANIATYKNYLSKLEEQISFLRDINGKSVEEIMGEYESIQESQREINDELEDLNTATSYCYFLREIIDEADSAKQWSDNPLNLEPSQYVYFGVECGENVTVDDIKQ